MFVKVKCEYPDYKDEWGGIQNGTKCYDCFSFKELYVVLKQINDEHVLSHIHLEFCIRELTDKELGEVIIPFEKGVIPIVSLY